MIIKLKWLTNQYSTSLANFKYWRIDAGKSFIGGWIKLKLESLLVPDLNANGEKSLTDTLAFVTNKYSTDKN